MRVAVLLIMSCVTPLLAQEQEAQRELIRRQQQSDAFTLQLRQSQELLKAPAEKRLEVEARQLAERQNLENMSERQLRDVKPDTPQQLRPYERQKAADERRSILAPGQPAE